MYSLVTRVNRRRAIHHIASIAVALAAVVACAPKPDPAEFATSTSLANRCPDLTKADDVAAFDFAKGYTLTRESAEKLKAASLATVEIATLADKLDAEFGIACAQVAHDLGQRGDWRSGNEACAAALKAVQEARAKLGPKAQVQLVVRSPTCLADASLYTKCASICDSSTPASKVRAECERKAGRCEGNCDGSCEPSRAINCNGVCQGSCDGVIKGACGGRCIGTCDGKRVNGGCIGFCIGTCEKGAINAECKGPCTGACKLDKPGICDGVCSGSCSIELSDVKCAGEFARPDVSSDCRARCDLAVINNTECSAPQVGFVATGMKVRETGDAMKVAVDRSFPGLIKVLNEVGEKGLERIGAARAVIDAARKGLTGMARPGGKASAAASEKSLVQCFDDPFKKAVAAATAITTSIDQAVAVRDEVSR